MADETSQSDFLDVHGLGPIDGEYAFTIEDVMGTLTHRELHKIKQIAGVRAGEIMEALEAGDSDVNLALAVIILTRHGRRFNEDLLWDAPVDAGFTFRFYDRDADDDEAGDDPLGRPVIAGGPSSSSSGSGVVMPMPSESQGTGLAATGSLASVRSAGYVRPTSGT